MPRMVRFAEILADTGVSHGLIGPREVPRLWDRHLLNCAVVAPAFGPGPVIDVGSGAGLPGIVLAVVRPDLELHLVEPMLRRTTWLESVLAELELPNVVVHRARAVEVAGVLSAPFVTARAVARLSTLARWCTPLLTPAGTLVAMKGRSAAEELEEDRAELGRLGLQTADLREYAADVLDEPVRTIELTFDPERAASVGATPRHRSAGRSADAHRSAERAPRRPARRRR